VLVATVGGVVLPEVWLASEPLLSELFVADVLVEDGFVVLAVVSALTATGYPIIISAVATGMIRFVMAFRSLYSTCSSFRLSVSL
jgi:hypothetical protein